MTQVASKVAYTRLQQISPLTSLRFFAAFWVLLYHTLSRPSDTSLLGAFISQFIDIGYSAVALFFVLSGFILINVYPRLESGGEVRAFFIARIARIYPLYALTLLADAPRLFLWRAAKYGAAKGFLATAASFGGSLTGLQVWIPSLAGLNFPSWSVATELFFYSIFPLLLPRISRVQTTHAAVRMAALCWLLFSLLPPLFLLGFSLTSEGVTTFAERNPLFRVSEFIIGALVGRIYQIRQDADEDENTTIASGLFLISGTGIIFMAAMHSANGFKILENALLVPFYASLIIATAMTAKRARMMSHPLLVALGAASYALYLTHALIWELFDRFGLISWPNAYLGYVAAAIGGSLLLHYTIEDVARRKILSASRMFHAWRPSPERRR